ncbi:cell division protein ZapA [Alkalithermobacter thermoalcaliphilus JW-YL-7 = DSM 7308]|uniref:Cell division protein ZapA n=1 Tax=Alkalithermobacter thermoalcaliphilus JW-YL-7 = DSM 7308 TaxID=1121328 RepID=A0A150FNY7_CLOPD|nr:protein of unknown function DUF710 [[Clostridium] paradoxum JW-YL-7 = DSM 7308]SHK55347.1 cell division protein ZapA [[Clostridium] paradoxum JW-YL-7 = DSM 7308]
MNKVTVKINGHEYTMVGSEPKEYLLTVANYVDEKMQEVARINPKLSTAMIAVLTSLNIGDELFKCSYELDNVKAQLEKPLQNLEDANTTVKSLKEEVRLKQEQIENMQKQILQYNKQISELEEKNKQLEEQLKEKDKRIKEAEEIVSVFQNRLYDYQMKIVELEKRE